MSYSVLNPCPTCGERFDFQLTGCMTFVDDFLMASTGGKCPKCGMQVVVDEPPDQDRSPVDSLSLAQTDAEVHAVRIGDLDLSVGCRVALTRHGIETVGDLLQLTKKDLVHRLGLRPLCIDEIDRLLAGKGLKQRECESDTDEH